MLTRTIAALLALLMIAGCLGGPAGPGTQTPTEDPQTDAPTVSPTPTTPDDGGLGEDGYYNAVMFEAPAVSAEQIARQRASAVADVGDDARVTVQAALENGSATVTVRSHEAGVPDSPGPLADGEFVRRNGTYYRVNATIADTRSGDGYRGEVVGPLNPAVHDDFETAQNESVPVENLSAAGRDLFALEAPDRHHRAGGYTSAGFYYLPPAGIDTDDSALFDGETTYVRDRGDLYRVQIETDGEPVVRMRVRYVLDPVADSASAFIEPRMSSLVTNMTADTPPAPARQVIGWAVANGSYDWEGTTATRPDRVEAAAAWIRSHGPRTQRAYLRVDGQLYDVRVLEAVE
jgi:hypothetical protein